MEDLTALCFILAGCGGLLSVMDLANSGIEQDVFQRRIGAVPTLVPKGSRLPTRMNHRMIALRELDLVESRPHGGHVFYNLTPTGQKLASAIPGNYRGRGVVHADTTLRASWRAALVASSYVRTQWLKYFMATESFNLRDLLKTREWITLRHAPLEERGSDGSGRVIDSGYRLHSTHWPEKHLDDIERREIHQGLRLWTDRAYLTDYRLPVDMESPFIYQTDSSTSNRLSLEYHVVRAWLDPEADVERFGQQVKALLSEWGVSRVTTPDLIIEMARTGGYAKQNLREMLIALYYKTNDYFFERGSEFLINRAFEDVRSEDFYVQIEGVWRTGLMLR